MKAWDREIVMKREWEAEVKTETKKEDAEILVSYAIRNNNPIDSIKEELIGKFGFSDEEADELIASKLVTK